MATRTEEYAAMSREMLQKGQHWMFTDFVECGLDRVEALILKLEAL